MEASSRRGEKMAEFDNAIFLHRSERHKSNICKFYIVKLYLFDKQNPNRLKQYKYNETKRKENKYKTVIAPMLIVPRTHVDCPSHPC
jgi:hypothetical protein